MSSFWDVFAAEIGRPAMVVAVLALTAMAVGHVTLRWWVRRRTREDGLGPLANAETVRRWLTRSLAAVLPPLILLVWVHGLSIAAGALLPHAPAVAEPARVALAWGYGLGVIGGLVWLLSRIGRLAEAFLAALAVRTGSAWDGLVLPIAGRALRRGLPLLALILGRPLFEMSPALAEIVGNATSLLLIGLVAFILFQVVDASAAFVLRQHRIDVADNLQARAIHTQVTVLKKVAVAVIAVFTLASMLMVFEPVRQFGASILASAGIAGIVIGFAAQRSIATLLAGFQIALTQPIRVDDVVIVENEWGRIEDITLTYVVVRIWDLRRLVLPITYFIEQPFQNWTRSSSEILGTVFLHVDYTLPIDALRGELTRILAASPHWDGRVNVLQVTNAKEHTLEVRALASAADASRAWDLRCDVRERLVAFVQREYPASLPRFRTSVDAPAAEADRAESGTRLPRVPA